MDPGELAGLRQEAEYLHRCLFRREASPPLVDGYLRAHAAMPELRAGCVEQMLTVRIIVVKRLDAVSIEPWLRGGRSRHALSAKLLLVAYLAECDGHHREFSRRSGGGWFNIIHSGLLAGISLLRGRFQKARHGLV